MKKRQTPSEEIILVSDHSIETFTIEMTLKVIKTLIRTIPHHTLIKDIIIHHLIDKAIILQRIRILLSYFQLFLDIIQRIAED